MKKTLLTIASIAITVGAVAQKMVNSTVSSSDLIPNKTIKGISVASTSTTVFAPPSFASTSCSLVTGYSVSGAGGIGGFVAGNNTYGDYEKAMMYSLSSQSLSLPATINQVSLYIGAIKAGGPGTGSITVKVYADNAGIPGTLLGTSSSKLVSSLTASSYTNNIFMFSSAVNLTSNIFYVSTDFSAAGLDTLSLVSTRSSTSTPCVLTNSLSAREKYNNAGTPAWETIAVGWGLKIDLGIFPVVTGNVSTGLQNVDLGLSNVSITPNPSNGIVNIGISLKNTENLTVSVSNALGQLVSSNSYNSISNETLVLDLSNQNNGLYFITVSNGIEKTVKRLVLSK